MYLVTEANVDSNFIRKLQEMSNKLEILHVTILQSVNYYVNLILKLCQLQDK